MEKLRYCDFCDERCDGKIVIKSMEFWKRDGSDCVVCNECFNLYANQEWEKLTKRVIDHR